MKAVILLSGGLDSAVAAAWAHKMWGKDCYALNFYYNQRHTKEVYYAQDLAAHFEWSYKLVYIKIPTESALISNSGDVNKIVRGLPASFVPGRNMIFLSLAASLAYTLEAENIVGGWNVIDYSGYPDCRIDFLKSMERTINYALGYDYPKMSIQYPLITFNKKEIILMGHELKVPFGMTWSCYEGGEKPCRICGSCLHRQKGFIDAGLEDE